MKISDLTLRVRHFAMIKGQISLDVTILIMIVLPVHYQYLPPLMILLCISGIHDALVNKEVYASINKYAKILCSLFIAFFIWQLITVIYSEDSKLAWSNVFGRLSLVIFPLAYFHPSERIIEKKSLLLRIFVIATCLYLLFCFGNAFSRSISFQGWELIFNPHPADAYWVNYFFELEFSRSIHPSYLSMYVIISVLISFESFYYFEKNRTLRFVWLVIAVFLLASLYFISSRAGILAAIIVVPIYLVVKIITVKKFRIFWCLFLLLMSFSLLIIKDNDKVSNLLNSFSHKGDAPKDDRFMVWRAALLRIKADPVLGVGIGDVRSELIEQYEINGQKDLAAQGLNAHNQFLETMLEGGIVEMMIIVSIFLFMIFAALREMNLLFGLYVVMMFIFFLFEATLYRLAGVAFFPLFSFLLLIQKKR